MIFETVQEAINTVDFLPRIVQMWAREFDLCRQQERNCRLCQGSHQCANPVRGFRMAVNRDSTTSVVYFSMVPCKTQMRAYREAEKAWVAKHCGLSSEEQRASFDNFDASQNPSAFQAARQYAMDFGRGTRHGLVFYGRPGSGKTHLASAIVNHLVQKGFQPAVVSVGDLAELIKSSYGEEGKTVREEIRALRSRDLVVLDDWGQEKATETTSSIILSMVSDRLKNDRPILATTNLPPDKLAAHVGGPMYSRLVGGCDFYAMTGDDYRKSIAMRRKKGDTM